MNEIFRRRLGGGQCYPFHLNEGDRVVRRGYNQTVINPPSMSNRRLALILGVANQRSIAWSCVQTFLSGNYQVILTHQERFRDKVESLVTAEKDDRILGHLSCDVETDLPRMFTEQIPELLATKSTYPDSIDVIVHCIAHGDLKVSLREVNWDIYSQAQRISAFSFLEAAQCAHRAQILTKEGASLIALSYLGAVRALYPYHVMGPAKAALESLVRGMALEFGRDSIRVNAVSAGPIATLSARGGIADFSTLQQYTSQTSPLGRPVTPQEVAQTILWVANSPAITGQTIYVDGGFSSIVPIGPNHH